MDAHEDLPPAGKAVLEIKDLNKSFGGLRAVWHFDLSLREGEIKGLIGPNGAGKSTVFNLVSGVYKPDGGCVTFLNEDITNRSPDQVAGRGIARTFQTVKVLADVTVLDTMKTACFLVTHYNALDALFQTGRYRRQEQELEEKALSYLRLLGIDHLYDQRVSELAYGIQRKVSIARSLTLSPRVLLLDEPMCGLNHTEKDELIETVLRLKDAFGLSIILVEHDMKVIMGICESVVVMNQGTVIAEGSGLEIRKNPEVIEAYLGTGATS